MQLHTMELTFQAAPHGSPTCRGIHGHTSFRPQALPHHPGEGLLLRGPVLAAWSCWSIFSCPELGARRATALLFLPFLSAVQQLLSGTSRALLEQLGLLHSDTRHCRALLTEVTAEAPCYHHLAA